MSTHSLRSRSWRLFATLMLLAALLLGTARAGEDRDREPGAGARSDEAYAELIHRLELGMTALKELGRHDALEVLARVTDEVRAMRKAARKQREAGRAPRALDLESRQDRLDILRLAKKAHAEAGRERAVDLLTRAIALGERQLAGADPEAVDRAVAEFTAEFTMEDLIHVLRAAGELYLGWGKADRAQACLKLSEFYAERERARAAAGADTGRRKSGEEGASQRGPKSGAPTAEEVLHIVLEQIQRLREQVADLHRQVDELRARSR